MSKLTTKKQTKQLERFNRNEEIIKNAGLIQVGGNSKKFYLCSKCNNIFKAKRKAVDARNAKKAVAKVPTNIIDSIKKRMDEWDEMDDNRRKEYIIKPGFRKKYFRALKLCIMHYGAFAINPVLNIVLAISQKASHTKDVRIRNELIRELNAEIKVTEEKIEDAKSNGDNQQKYKLMRIKEKLQAEVTRVQANTKFI